MSCGLEAEFFRDDLRQHRADAGADVLHARQDLDRAIAQHAHLAGRIGLHISAQRHQRRCRGRRVHHGATVLIENGVILVLAAECETSLAALADAIVARRAEIPATGSLQQVPADRRHVSDLRARGQLPATSAKRSVALSNQRMARDPGLSELHPQTM